MLCLAVLGGCVADPAPKPPAGPSSALDTKTACAYTQNRISLLTQFGQLTGRSFSCGLVFNNIAADWSTWQQPWFAIHNDPDQNWAAWVRTDPGRRLVITQSMTPVAPPADWRQQGAAGAYDAHARTLATNLVAAGLGASIIRLAHEANGDWGVNNIGTTTDDFNAWRTYWARIVTVMRSVPGAHFEFDWCVNGGYRPIPFDAYYPGDSVVDIVGIDDYDSPVSTTKAPNQRWADHYNRPYGLRDLLTFATAHAKPLAISEWGLWTPTNHGAGDDPAYVNGMASVIRSNIVRYQSFFNATVPSASLALDVTTTPGSIAAYASHFGPGGDLAR